MNAIVKPLLMATGAAAALGAAGFATHRYANRDRCDTDPFGNRVKVTDGDHYDTDQYGNRVRLHKNQRYDTDQYGNRVLVSD